MTVAAFSHRVQAEARGIDPVKAAIFLLVAIPFAIGWTARIAWIAVSLLLAGTREGWRQANTQIEARHRRVST